MSEAISLSEHLLACAHQWCAAHGDAKLATLGRVAMNDTAFFTRDHRHGPTTATLEKFAAFLADLAQWPDGAVPREVCEFVHRVEGRTPEACLATGKADAISPGEGSVR